MEIFHVPVSTFNSWKVLILKKPPFRVWIDFFDFQNFLSNLLLQSINSCGEGESFPFANDNAGTIRMRSNSHVQAMLEQEEMLDQTEQGSTGQGNVSEDSKSIESTSSSQGQT